MGFFAGILGGIGGLCAVLGIVTILGLVTPVKEGLTWQFWFGLSVILFLATIAIMSRGGRRD